LVLLNFQSWDRDPVIKIIFKYDITYDILKIIQKLREIISGNLFSENDYTKLEKYNEFIFTMFDCDKLDKLIN
jgi:hypothetical protein